MNLKPNEIKLIHELLEEKYHQFNQKDFIVTDPILIPHRYSKKEDIEIAGFLVATIAWGQRKTIIQNGRKWMGLMNDSPYDFVMNFSKSDEKRFLSFVHRTFNSTDCIYFLKTIRTIYEKHGGLEQVFSKEIINGKDLSEAIHHFRTIFLSLKHENRTEKHISDPLANSSAKRICMYLRWMVRKDKKGVDFGIWKHIQPSQLCLPLDVHTGNVSRRLGLLGRTQNDWKSVQEITNALKTFDAKDPVKYDFSLFGLGAFEGFK